MRAHNIRANDDPAREVTPWRGLDIAIEVRGGETRHPGSEFEVTLPHEWVGYGYFENIDAPDGDSLDVIVGPMFYADDNGPDIAFVAEQLNAETGEFQQEKVLLGFTNEEAAQAAFLEMWPEHMFGGIRPVPTRELVDSIKDQAMETEARVAAPTRLRERTEYDHVCPHCDEIIHEKGIYSPDRGATIQHRACGGAITFTRTAAKPKYCSHCGKEITANELFGRDDRWFHRPCISKGPIALEKKSGKLPSLEWIKTTAEEVLDAARANEPDSGVLTDNPRLIDDYVDGMWREIARALPEDVDEDEARRVVSEAAKSIWLTGHFPRQAESLTRSQYRSLVHRSVKAKELGEIEGYRIFRVDGTWIRDNVDVDFVAGGNCARYKYVPDGEVWIENDLSDKDAAATIVHEVVECDAMLDGQSYEETHAFAGKIERVFRDQYDGGNAFRAAEKFLLSGADEEEPELEPQPGEELRVGAIEVTAADVGGLQLRRKGYQRYVAEHVDEKGEKHKVWIGGESKVEHGSYSGNTRQRRKTVWVVKIDGEEVGEEKTLKDARELAEAKLGIVQPVTPVSPAAPAAGPAAGTVEVSIADVLAAPKAGPDPLAVLHAGMSRAMFSGGGAHAERQGAQEDDRTVLLRGGSDGLLGGRRGADDLRGPPAGGAPGATPAPVPERGRGKRPVAPKKPAPAPKKPKSPKETGEGYWEPQPFRPASPPALVDEVYDPETKHVRTYGEFRDDPMRLRRPGLEFDPRDVDQDYLDFLEQSLARPRPQQYVRDPAALSLGPIQELDPDNPGDQGFKNIVAILSKATPEELDYWQHWYGYGHLECVRLARVHNRPVDLVAGVIAVLSPKEFWEQNLYLADRALAEDWANVRALNDSRAKAYALVVEGDFSAIAGGKVFDFFLSLADPVAFEQRVVVDTHAINIWRGLREGKAPSLNKRTRAMIARDYTRAGQLFDLTPQAVQAITWVLWRQYPTLKGTAPIEVEEKGRGKPGKGRLPEEWSFERDRGLQEFELGDLPDELFTPPLGRMDYSGSIEVTAMKTAVVEAGFEVKHKEPFIAHATLAYCDGRSYDGPVPEGSFTAEQVEVWGWPTDDVAALKTARKWKLPVELGAVVVSGEELTLERSAGRHQKRKKSPKEKRKRFFQPTWYLKEGSNVAFTAAYGTSGREIKLAPGARVLDLSEDTLRKHAAADPGAAELVAAVREQAEAIKNLSAVMDKLLAANTGGYDAVRTEDRLIVLNPKAVADTPQRRHWMEAR